MQDLKKCFHAFWQIVEIATFLMVDFIFYVLEKSKINSVFFPGNSTDDLQNSCAYN